MYIVTLSFPPPCRLFICFFAIQPPFSVCCAAPAVAHSAARPVACSLPPPFSVRFRYPCPLRILPPALLRRSATSVLIRRAALSTIFLFLPPVLSAFLPQRFARARFCVIMILC